MHFDAVESGASESNAMQPYGHASHAAFRFALVAWLGSIKDGSVLWFFHHCPVCRGDAYWILAVIAWRKEKVQCDIGKDASLPLIHSCPFSRSWIKKIPVLAFYCAYVARVTSTLIEEEPVLNSGLICYRVVVPVSPVVVAGCC